MLKRGFKAMLAEAKAVIETVSVQDLPYHLDDREVLLVDVRETVERERNGAIPGSIHVPRGLLCGTGGRSALAAKTLQDMGYEDVATLSGGYDAWRLKEEG
jgi:rhodanese-related sulfurtransferase